MIFTINGIGDSAAGTTDKLAAFLKTQHDLDVVPLRYKPVSWRTARDRTRMYETAGQMIRVMTTYDGPHHIVGHSWGCGLTAAILNHAPDGFVESCTLFNAALDRDWVFPLSPERFDRITNVWNPCDFALFLGKMLGRWHPFGGLGSEGHHPKRPDDRITDIEMRFSNTKHSHNPFSDPDLLWTAAQIVKETIRA